VIRLRSFRKHDLPRLYELDQACFAQGIAYSMADLRYFLANPRSLALVAEDALQDGAGERLAGFIIVERLRRRGEMAGHIITIDVERGMRRQGVGSLLLVGAEARLKEEGIARLGLEVAEDNSGAQAFYRRFGFTAVGHIPNYYAGGLTALVMEKPL
jgi:[ribosomal protein S18]-alanine N-acetyltransferase